MQSAVRLVVCLFLLSSVLGGSYQSGPKLRRDGVLNLYPFPRVGRASHHTWQIPINDLYLEYDPVDKRQLYAFPRVGRSELSLLRPEQHLDALQPVPARRTEGPGMWFGPRLGRSFKSDEDEITIQNNNLERSEPELMERKKRNAHLN
ncbi:CAPA peptides [Manduca sexta]|uniref:CAPA n=1 Tax=Manduca sexta TaxID=7130 RepID=Q6DQW2_MANSE|nr:CAPA peptides [Manduca sexta]AAT69684.1 CAPA [Manduca sexta]KAG6440347.1 hypothetical protein O3G_MSEX001195 [Manduca sexta]KAG6440348.1 hypothetical protein O3G_MSEX001195 [Manduca sexta]